MFDLFSEMNEPARWHDQADLQSLRGWFGQNRFCPACGRMHAVQTRMMEEGPDIARHISRYLSVLGLRGRCLVVMDEHTRKAAGDALMEGLEPYRPEAVVFQREDLHADEEALGDLLVQMSDKPDFLVSCGSGTLTDITRYDSYMTGIPFVSYATASSVDGYASGTAPLTAGGYKMTYPGTAPEAIFYDPDVLAAAPRKMTAAGFGDVLAKVIALMDWRLAYVTEDEAYCPLVAAFVDKAVQACLDLADDLAVQSRPGSKGWAARGRACSRLMETLALTGFAMQMMGTSRPASGCEHQISHMLEMRDLQLHRPGSLHGDKVGIGTLIGMYFYMRMFESGHMPVQKPILPADQWVAEVRRVYGRQAEKALRINQPEPPQGEVWEQQKARIARAMDQFGYAAVERFKTLLPVARDKILAMGGPVRPDQLGYSVQDTYDAIAFGKENRPKFTTLRLAERFGWLYDLAHEVAEGLPHGHIY